MNNPFTINLKNPFYTTPHPRPPIHLCFCRSAQSRKSTRSKWRTRRSSLWCWWWIKGTESGGNGTPSPATMITASIKWIHRRPTTRPATPSNPRRKYDSCSRISVQGCICLTVCLSVCLTDCLSVWLSVCLTVCLSVCLTVCLSVCLSVWPSVHPSFPPSGPSLKPEAGWLAGWLGFRPGWLGLRPGWLGLRPGWLAQRGMYVWTNERMKISPFYRTLSPIGAAAQKARALSIALQGASHPRGLCRCPGGSSLAFWTIMSKVVLSLTKCSTFPVI